MTGPQFREPHCPVPLHPLVPALMAAGALAALIIAFLVAA